MIVYFQSGLYTLLPKNILIPFPDHFFMTCCKQLLALYHISGIHHDFHYVELTDYPSSFEQDWTDEKGTILNRKVYFQSGINESEKVGPETGP